MITIKLKAADVKLIKRAAFDDVDWASQVSSLLNEKIEQAEAEKLFKATKPAGMTVNRAMDLARGILGDGVVIPPAPDGAFYAVLSRHLSQWKMTEESLTELFEYVKANLSLPAQFEFIIKQHPRILAGTWNRSGKKHEEPAWRKDTLPEN